MPIQIFHGKIGVTPGGKIATACKVCDEGLCEGQPLPTGTYTVSLYDSFGVFKDTSPLTAGSLGAFATFVFSDCSLTLSISCALDGTVRVRLLDQNGDNEWQDYINVGELSGDIYLPTISHQDAGCNTLSGPVRIVIS